MKTDVFLREEKEFRSVFINESSVDIEEKLLKKWQNILDILADITDVPAALVMKITKDSMKVTLSNKNKKNPYKKGDVESLGSGLYCETVIGKNKKLFIKNALNNNFWKNNPDIKLDMVSYYGLPIKWPDGKVYGTICLLDKSEINMTATYKRLIKKFKNVIEQDLKELLKKKQFRIFFEVNTDLLCIIDLNGNFIKVNKAWEKLLGYRIKDIEEMNIFDFIHQEDIDDTNKIIEKLKKDKNINKFVNRYKDKNDNYHYIEWSSNNRLQGDYFYASARDITKEKKQENRLRYQNELQDIIRNISLNLLELDSSNIDKIIDKNLERLKVFLKKNSYYILKKEKELLEFINIFIKLMNSVQKIVKENIESNNKFKNLNIRLKREIEIKNAYHMAFLKSQIKPHFLFNTLSTIINLSNKKPDKSFELIEKLADFLKYNYEISPSKDYSTFKKELDQINLYMDIQKERFEERISFKTIFDENILNYKIPYLMIQPLIENALFHGILKKIDGGEIILKIEEKDEKIDVSVIDTGVGFEKEAKFSEEDSTGVGLVNIDKRLRFIFDEELKIISNKNKTIIKFAIPKIIKLPDNEKMFYNKSKL